MSAPGIHWGRQIHLQQLGSLLGSVNPLNFEASDSRQFLPFLDADAGFLGHVVMDCWNQARFQSKRYLNRNCIDPDPHFPDTKRLKTPEPIALTQTPSTHKALTHPEASKDLLSHPPSIARPGPQVAVANKQDHQTSTWTFKVPKNHGLCTHYFGIRSIILGTVGVQIDRHSSWSSEIGS